MLKCHTLRYLGKKYFTQLYKRNDDKMLLNHVLKFDGKSVRRKQDFLEFLQNKFYEANNKNYTVYKAGAKVPRLLLGCILLIGLNLSIGYYMFDWSSKVKMLLWLCNLVVLYKAVKSNCWQIRKYIKSIDVSKELDKVNLLTYTNKHLSVNPEDIFFVKNSYFYMVQKDFLWNICVEIDIQGVHHYIQLHNVLVLDKDIFSAVLKGYKLKKIA
jgi:hypothetical protein